jgi:signal transduction histidine kinase/CheY-like chemotaxis protein/HPt (histidine-containing phosphotransfer) domain-containing protein
MLHPDHKPTALDSEFGGANVGDATAELALALRRLDRERRARQQAEAVLEAKSLDLYQKHQELVRANAKLEERVRERTAELADAVARAEYASAAKGEFLARMSHEIRTPMNGVIGMLEALKETAKDGRQADYIATAHTSAENLLRIINDILDFSKIEAGQLTLETVEFDIRSMLTHVIHLWEQKAQASKLELKLSIDSALPRWLMGDSARLTQVLSNLVNNALKFTHTGSVTVRANLVPTQGARSRVRFTVADTGIGLTEEAKKRLFVAFMQADGSTSRRYGGTGLGLVICRQLIALMGGELTVESKAGVGSTFAFELDFDLAAADMNIPRPAINEQNSNDAKTSFSGCVLVVDDNDTNRKVAVTILTRLGLRSDVAEDGEQAVKAIHEKDYDLVLMDCHMPGIDGYEATGLIRVWEAEHGRSALPIVALTASAFKEDRERCAAAGMSDFLPKPINLASMRKLLARWLVKSDASAALTVEQIAPVSASSLQRETVNTDIAASIFDTHIEKEQFNQLRALLGVGFEKMISRYEVSATEALDCIRKAASNKDAAALKLAAHRLGGAAAMMGIKSLADPCMELEALARDGLRADPAASIQQVADVCAQVNVILRSYHGRS